MYSREYVRARVLGKKGDRRAKFYAANLAGVFFFITVAALIAPIAHELAHLAVLEMNDCYYYIDLKLNLESGLYGLIEPACALTERNEALLYTSGFMTNLVLAASFFMLASGIHMRGMLNHANFLMYVALGFLTEPLFYSFAVEGDAVNALSAIGRPEWMPYVSFIGFMIFSLSILYVYFYMESFIEDNLRIQQEVLEAEEFISEIRG